MSDYLTAILVMIAIPIFGYIYGHKQWRHYITTEREALRSQERYQKLVDTVEGIVWEAAAVTDTLRFTFVSAQAERLLGYPVTAWLSDPDFYRDHVQPEDHDRVIDSCRELMQEKKSRQFDFRMIAADGRTLWLRNSASVIAEDGQPPILRGLMLDITERRK